MPGWWPRCETPEPEALPRDGAEDEPADDRDLDEEALEADEDAGDEAPRPGREELQAELDRQAHEFGLDRITPQELYGPNGQTVAVFLDRLGRPGFEHLEDGADAWRSIDRNERYVARKTADRLLAADPDLRAADSNARSSVAAWERWLFTNVDPADAEATATAREADRATLDAVTALVLKRELSDADFAALCGPWAEALADTLPEPEPDADEGAEAGAETAAATEGAAAEDDEDEEGAYGPCTAEVVQLLKALAELTGDQVGALAAAWKEQPRDELREAHRSIEAICEDEPDCRDQLRQAQAPVLAWMDDRRIAAHEALYNPKRVERRANAGRAIADAVSALVLADLLEPEDSQRLYHPWASVVGSRELPRFADPDAG